MLMMTNLGMNDNDEELYDEFDPVQNTEYVENSKFIAHSPKMKYETLGGIEYCKVDESNYKTADDLLQECNTNISNPVIKPIKISDDTLFKEFEKNPVNFDVFDKAIVKNIKPRHIRQFIKQIRPISAEKCQSNKAEPTDTKTLKNLLKKNSVLHAPYFNKMPQEGVGISKIKFKISKSIFKNYHFHKVTNLCAPFTVFEYKNEYYFEIKEDAISIDLSLPNILIPALEQVNFMLDLFNNPVADTLKYRDISNARKYQLVKEYFEFAGISLTFDFNDSMMKNTIHYNDTIKNWIYYSEFGQKQYEGSIRFYDIGKNHGVTDRFFRFEIKVREKEMRNKSTRFFFPAAFINMPLKYHIHTNAVVISNIIVKSLSTRFLNANAVLSTLYRYVYNNDKFTILRLIIAMVFVKMNKK
ncbi:MAG: hypothetical protein A2015_03735 [Spirochaetes bacterium GWF1_31_7]|nr:MAG: hypothetical protein A2015_03735 [Spirochaetes bacterium GWF1_31_7]HBD94722.1 hypothetical protein [Spirochaetia bacterium]HBI39050.1 hypothetical protein [Spirochaetia bacterium]